MTDLDKLDAAFAAAIAQLKSIVVTEGIDAGVVLLDHESTTHYDPAHKCQVYDNENFSPLGDGLVKLHELLTALNWPAMRDELRALRKRCSELWDVLHDSAGTVACDGNDELYRRVTAELDKGAFGVPCDVDAVLGD